MLAQDRQRLATESAELQARGLAVAEKRLRAGDIAPVERSRLAVDKARADNEARQAQSDLEQARQALAYLVGYDDPAQPLLAVDAWPAPGAQPGDARLDQRPDLEAARRRMAAAQADRDLARSLRQRDLSIGMQLERNNQGSPTNSFGLGVSMPLFVWHEHEGEIRRAETDLESRRLQYEQTRALAGTQMYQARSALLAAGDRLQRLEQGLLADAERVGAAAELAYNKGAMGLIDLLDARRTLRQVRLEAATARADYAKALSDWQLMAEYGKEQ
jgi:cobalt-zinc-cadmium efflux system outer membrane protein